MHPYVYVYRSPVSLFSFYFPPTLGCHDHMLFLFLLCLRPQRKVATGALKSMAAEMDRRAAKGPGAGADDPPAEQVRIAPHEYRSAPTTSSAWWHHESIR